MIPWVTSRDSTRNFRRALTSRFCVCLTTLLLTSGALSQTPVRRNVLIVNEVGIAHPAAALVTEKVISQLGADPHFQSEFYVESLDSPLFRDEASQKDLGTGLEDKYRGRNIDAIIAMGPTPIRFLLEHPEFLPDAPVVICGSTRAQAGNPTLPPRFTGSWMDFDLARTVDLVKILLPETTELVVVSGSSLFDKATLTMAKASLEDHPAPLRVSHLAGLDMNSLLMRLRQLPKGSVVLYLSFFRDVRGSQFVNATTALPLVSEAANVPVFGISDTYIGHGIVGGYVVSFAQQAEIAARIATQLFAGKKPAEIPVTVAPSRYILDSKQMKRWGLVDARLPTGSMIVGREPSLWQRGKWFLAAGLAAILGLVALVVFLFREQRQLDAARKEQMRLSGMLIQAHEEERRRIAAELHDDLSQRLALLSLGLENAADEAAGSPAAAAQINELINAASELGADLHTLSHRLHSSTLEKLGLAPGISAFCKEFAAQNGTKVAFSHGDLPQSVSPEVALCLFRIVQEALRNVKKHSGAANAQVKLESTSRELHLSIADDGRGFDPQDPSGRQGLGLWSMQERVRLVGGRFKLDSRHGEGTRIEVWAPLKAEWIPASGTEDVEQSLQRSFVA